MGRGLEVMAEPKISRKSAEAAAALRTHDASGAEFQDVGELLERHLVPQDYAAYTPSAQEVWREALTRNRLVVAEHAERIHPAYLDGLQQLAFPKSIPRTEDLNTRLEATGWQIVGVDGYIPATAYASLMAECIFPVSSRIRRPEHIDFAPEPDMIHDILGHLPMLFCAEHRDYLRELARVARRAKPNQLDTAFFDSVRHMAALKTADDVNPARVAAAEQRVEAVYSLLVNSASEVTCLRRIYTWSIEFGIFRDGERPLVHGAALLSAPTELRRALSGRVTLEPYSADVVRHEHPFSDLLERFFVATGYEQLHEVLVDFMLSQPGLTYPSTSEVRELGRSTRGDVT
jgi:phenylalanine-4-hydroxylase